MVLGTKAEEVREPVAVWTAEIEEVWAVVVPALVAELALGLKLAGRVTPFWAAQVEAGRPWIGGKYRGGLMRMGDGLRQGSRDR